MLKDYLDRNIYDLIIKSFSFNDITEIRLRVNAKIIIVIKSKKYFLKDDRGEYVFATKDMLENFIVKCSENSLYAYNENIINGYITLPKGIRVGLCGKVVTDGNKIITIKEFQSVNIRIPHFVKNCSLPVYDLLVADEVKNTLIISSPGSGKTTFLRDIVFQMAQHNLAQNILIADEREEICSVQQGEAQIDLGDFCDIYSNCNKAFAFKNGIRSMRPDVIVTDELDLDRDLECLVEATNCGVKVMATIHAKNLEQLKMKNGFERVLKEKFFERFVVLSCDNGVGTINQVFDEKLNCIYVGG